MVELDFMKSHELFFELHDILVYDKGYYEVNYRNCNRFVKHPHLEMYKSEAINYLAPELKKRGYKTNITNVPYVNHKVLVSITHGNEPVNPLSLIPLFREFEVIT